MIAGHTVCSLRMRCNNETMVGESYVWFVVTTLLQDASS